MNSPTLRDLAVSTAAANWSGAADLARRIDDPFYASQAFAWAARYAPTAEALPLIDESFRRASAGKDGYQRLAATAWPLRALIELGHTPRATTEFERVAPLATLAAPIPSRAEACMMVFEAVVPGDHLLAEKSVLWLQAYCQPSVHWRQRRAVRNSLRILTWLYPDLATRLLPLVQDPSLRACTATSVVCAQSCSPRSFFW